MWNRLCIYCARYLADTLATLRQGSSSFWPVGLHSDDRRRPSIIEVAHREAEKATAHIIPRPLHMLGLRQQKILAPPGN
jgi:hypothetical protein